jgi:hypothetical protein
MKKYVEILAEIRETKEAIRIAETKEKELVESYTKVCDLRERHTARKAVENEITANAQHEKDLKITMKILQNNAKVALFNEVLPLALDILKKYSGKQYGEKTRNKIKEEVKVATNCDFYITSSYSSQYFEVYPVDAFRTDYNITCGTEYTGGSKKPLLIDNKIQEITFDEIALYYITREYVEDIPQRVIELKVLYAKAVEKQKELETICNKYNSLTVGDIQHIYKDKVIYEGMRI